MTLTKTVSTFRTEEINIKIPNYWKSNNGYFVYRIYNDDSCVQISLFENWGTSIGLVSYTVGLNNGCIGITKEEFDLAFEIALTILKA